MTRKHHYDPVLDAPLPSRKGPAVLILLLIAGMVIGWKYFFGNPQLLLGGPVPPNSYHKYLTEPVAPPKTVKPMTPLRPAPKPASKPQE